MAPSLDRAETQVPKQNSTPTANRFGIQALVISVLAFAVLIAPTMKALAQLLRVDDESRATRALTPIWEDLVAPATTDEIRTASLFDRLFSRPKACSRRQRIEVADAVGMISQYAEPLPVEIDEMIESNVREDDQEEVRSAVELLLAAKHLAALCGLKNAATLRSATRDTDDIDGLARVWRQARNITEAVSP